MSTIIRGNSWVEISKNSLKNNIKILKGTLGRKTLLGASVKANAYGHGIIPVSRLALICGADWLCVNSLEEAALIRGEGVNAPIYIMGYVKNGELEDAVRLGCRMVVYEPETVFALAKAADALKKKVFVHIKIETGNYRQGIDPEKAVDFCRMTKASSNNIIIEGIATHFANIEDVKLSGTNGLPPYPGRQLDIFLRAWKALKKCGFDIKIRHCANSAATLLFPETHGGLVRPGIALYGMWPSREVEVLWAELHPNKKLKPVLSWKSIIAQIKTVPRGEGIGYGGTYVTTKKTKIAVVPVGYYDGYDRGFSNCAEMIVEGKKAKVRGRVCMNMCMIDVTGIKARAGDRVTLIGDDGNASMSADNLAGLIGTINYEVTTRIREGIPRIITD